MNSVVSLLLISIFVIGCQKTDATSPRRTSQQESHAHSDRHDHDHDHDEDEDPNDGHNHALGDSRKHDHKLEHGIPDHKPETLQAAIGHLSRYQKRVMSELKAGHADHANQAFAKLRDVIRWLPELAADTDMGEADWNVVQEVSINLEKITSSWISSNSLPTSKDLEEFQSTVSELQKLSDQTIKGSGEPNSAEKT